MRITTYPSYNLTQMLVKGIINNVIWIVYIGIYLNLLSDINHDIIGDT